MESEHHRKEPMEENDLFSNRAEEVCGHCSYSQRCFNHTFSSSRWRIVHRQGRKRSRLRRRGSRRAEAGGGRGADEDEEEGNG